MGLNIIPCFKSAYSIGRSILTFEKAGASSESEADSIIDLALANNLKQVFAIEDSMTGFLEAYTNCQAAKLQLVYGVRINVCPDMSIKDEDSLSKTCKYVIFMKNSEGYKRLVKIWTAANLEGFYYEPRIDFKTLKSLWSNKDLKLCIPFYDSYLFKNLLHFGACLPNIDFTDPTYLIEDNQLPFDNLLLSKVKETKGEIFPVQSVYYAKKADFKFYLTFRCINNRSTLNKPELDHMTSNTFCLEHWKELNS